MDMADSLDSVGISTARIIIIGPSGVGKSSLVNLLSERELAPTNDSAVGCTFDFTLYKIQYRNQNFEFIDTVGLNEHSNGTVPPKQALRMLIKFIQQNKNGFNCIILVMRKGRIEKAVEDNYNLFCKSLWDEKIPTILYVGHCEEDDPMDSWMRNGTNQAFLAQLNFKKIVCGTTKFGGRFGAQIESLRNSTYTALWGAIIENKLREPFKMESKLNSFKKAWNRFCDSMGLKWKFVSNQFQDFLRYLKTVGIQDEDINEIKKALH